ncbi:WD40-repeat-containing domain protein [Dissophora ornata]|nr:WD40-repeat-containing domain protein [Dissophora ornata]
MPSKNTQIPHHHHVNAAVEELLNETRSTGLVPQIILDKIEELSKQWDIEAIIDTAGSLWKKALDVYISLSGSYDTIVRHDKLAKLLIRKIAWHPHQPLLAIALWNDSAWVYDLSVEAWYSCGLSYPAQSRIMSLEWKPMSGVVLAIGCADGVALWHVFRDHSPFGAEAALKEPNPLKDRPSELLSEVYSVPSKEANHGRDTAWVGLNLFKELEGGVNHMSWNPRGELLAVGSEHSSTVYIRDGTSKILTELRLSMKPTPPHSVRSLESLAETISNVKAALGSATTPNLHTHIRPTHEKGFYGSTVCYLSWSPCGQNLLIAYRSEVVRIYEAATWEYVEIKDLGGTVQSACWTPDGSNLIYSLQDDDIIRAIHFEHRSGGLDWIPLNFAKMSLRYEDIEAYKSALRGQDSNGEHERIRDMYWRRFGCRRVEELEEFGPIEELALDPIGERLVVRFRNTEFLGIVAVKTTGSMLKDLDIFTPIGLAQGPGWNGQQPDEEDEERGGEPKAITMAFKRQSDGSSVLAMVWESGQINFVPLYYSTRNENSTR